MSSSRVVRPGTAALVLASVALVLAGVSASPTQLTVVGAVPQPNHSEPLTPEQWSSILGWISIACWGIPGVSQLIENYQLKSGEGLSISFVVIWFLGDALNMIGAIRQGLLLTMIVLAGYYCLCDIGLAWQWWFYRKHRDFYHPSAVIAQPDETSTLLPGSARDASASAITVPSKPPNTSTLKSSILKYGGAFVLVVLTGLAAWFAAERSGSAKHPHAPPEKREWKWDAQILGWLSAALYLSSRCPQIWLNATKTKCEGLSLALFVFALGGNIFYFLSIIVKNQSHDYLLENASWMVGSLGTVFLDIIVLSQFVYYRKERQAMRLAAANAQLTARQNAAITA